MSEVIQEQYKLYIESNDYIVSYYLGLANIVERIDCDELLFYPTYLLVCNYYVTWLNSMYMFSNAERLFNKDFVVDKIDEYEMKTITNCNEQKLKECSIEKNHINSIFKKFRKLKKLYFDYVRANTIKNRLMFGPQQLDADEFKECYDDFINSSLKLYYVIVGHCLKSWYYEAKNNNEIELFSGCNNDYIRYFGKPIESI